MTTENAGTANPSQVLPPPESRPRAAVHVVGPPRGAASRLLPPRPRRNPYRRRAVGVLVAADGLVALTVAVPAAAPSGGGPDPLALALFAVLLPLVLLPLNARGGLYRTALTASALDELPALLGRTATAWCAAAAVLAALHPGGALGWTTLPVVVAAHTLLACAARGAVHLGRRLVGRRRPRSALVVGTGPAGRRITTALQERSEYGMRPVGMVEPGETTGTGAGAGDEAVEGPAVPVPVLTRHEEIVRAVIQNAVRDAVFTRDPALDPETAALVPLFEDLDCTVWLVGEAARGAAASAAGAPRPREGDHLWGFACRRLATAPRRRPVELRCKRALDVAVAAVALVLAAPVLLACALAVRIADGPGVIFRQERIGLGGRPFTVLKFRTLRPRDEHESATRWNVADDRRMSTVGHLLRRTSLDELPQLWNVLRGDMSLVGPRPERPYFVQRFSGLHPGYAARHRMPAGITGLAQVHGLRGDTSIEDRARFDNHYIDTWSLWQDVRILLHTAGSLFRLGGS
ncbi:exopolysaccharide biosynthesis polyprenyl glycosylphosphotransferase [Streptomyces sp. TRM43335]|uniref:Exopolysaccharide biosynthesis polyprenyl glycosylphosphotransferase n=1 Tax=Streptomyces taklimakanensis TaxID=2569853 RepID=A0A6G2BI56_9ACTN|nr:exopolysaccharide biosynthesis polyprenyl glycosylphosphotransferase [Streptomyces taklimakanensis]MTE21806.1 exopolysaccharide biosynthesis polyprenyl glycosylphosphotransferase [Streptomyces taklimakanensis]